MPSSVMIGYHLGYFSHKRPGAFIWVGGYLDYLRTAQNTELQINARGVSSELYGTPNELITDIGENNVVSNVFCL